MSGPSHPVPSNPSPAMRHPIRCLLPLLSTLFASAAASAQDIVLPAVGSTAIGTPFDQRAAAGTHLGTVSVYAGGFVEGLQLESRNRWGASTFQSPLFGAANVAVDGQTPAGVEYLTRVDVWVQSGLVNKIALETSAGRRQTFGSTRVGEVQTVFAAGSGREIIGLHGSASATVYSLGVITRPLLATSQVYGTPCQTSLGPVTLRYRPGYEFLLPGGQTIVEMTNVPSTYLGAIITAGFSRTQVGNVPLPLDLGPVGAPGCTVWTSNESVTFVGRDPGNTNIAGWALFVPNTTALAGVVLNFQGYVLGPWNPASLAASSAFTGMVGRL